MSELSYANNMLQVHLTIRSSTLTATFTPLTISLQFFAKEGLDMPGDMIEATIHCKPGAAVALLAKAFTLLTKRE